MKNGKGAAPSMLEQLWAIEQIKALKSRYFQAVDGKDFGAIASIFTDDAVVDFSGEIPHRIGHQGITAENADPAAWRVLGGEAAGAVIGESVRNVVTVHQGQDPRIVLTTGTAATGRWSLHDIMVFEDETMHGYGHYTEDYRLVDGEWRISSLLLTRLRVVWEPRVHPRG